jgi:molybdopterin molybdotransferase
MLTIEQAQEILFNDVPPLRVIRVALHQSLGHVLTEDVVASEDHPAFDRSMMDGFAVASEQASKPGAVFEIALEIAAGERPSQPLPPATCARIMTGAAMPANADAVLQHERTREEGSQVTFLDAVAAGQNVEKKGNEAQKGQTVLKATQIIRPQELAVLATFGIPEVSVYRKPTCGMIATGDELVEPEVLPELGQIRNSNGYSVRAQVMALGLECDYLGIARDDKEDLRHRIRFGLAKFDVLLLSGGVSAGMYDLVIETLREEGVEFGLHKVAIKPGKPFFYGRRRDQRVFGLPGNPFSTFVTFEVFVRPFLGMMHGRRTANPRIRAKLKSGTGKPIDRVHYMPGKLSYPGEFLVEPIPYRSSGDMISVTKANCFVVVPIGTAYQAGDTAEIMMMGNTVWSQR